MDTAYVREDTAPKSPYKVQYLHFWYLKLLVIIFTYISLIFYGQLVFKHASPIDHMGICVCVCH